MYNSVFRGEVKYLH